MTRLSVDIGLYRQDVQKSYSVPPPLSRSSINGYVNLSVCPVNASIKRVNKEVGLVM